MRQRRLPSGVLEQDVISSEGIRDADDALVLGLVDWCDSADILTGISLLRAVELRDEDLIWRVGQSISRLSHGPSESHLVKVSSHLTDDWIKQIHRSETFAALVEIGVSVNAVSRAFMTWLNECGSDRLVHFNYLPAFDDFCLDAFAELFEKLAKFSEHRELCATLLLKLVRGDRMPSAGALRRFFGHEPDFADDEGLLVVRSLLSASDMYRSIGFEVAARPVRAHTTLWQRVFDNESFGEECVGLCHELLKHSLEPDFRRRCLVYVVERATGDERRAYLSELIATPGLQLTQRSAWALELARDYPEDDLGLTFLESIFESLLERERDRCLAILRQRRDETRLIRLLSEHAEILEAEGAD